MRRRLGRQGAGASSRRGRPRRAFSPGAARILYNVADAWIPRRPGKPGGGDVDFLPALARKTRPLERLGIELATRALEWEARFRLSGWRGFAWRSRAERQAVLESWQRSRFALRRRVAQALRARIEAAYTAQLAHAAAGEASPPLSRFHSSEEA